MSVKAECSKFDGKLNDFSYPCFIIIMPKLYLIFFLICYTLSALSCTKVIVHQYPIHYTGEPEQAVDKFEFILKNGELYFFKATDSTEIPFVYSNGVLNIINGVKSDSIWAKSNSLVNPITKLAYSIDAQAQYNPEFDADEFIVSISTIVDDSVIAFIEGSVDDATVIYGQNTFRFISLGISEPQYQELSTYVSVINEYPYGETWSLIINDVIVGEIVQGSPVIYSPGTDYNYGVSYTFLFIEKIEPSTKAELINSMLAYLSLLDMEFYYYECDINNLRDEDCPELIKIQ